MVYTAAYAHPIPFHPFPFHSIQHTEESVHLLSTVCFTLSCSPPPPAPAAHAGGAQEDAVLQRIEAALTQRDEFGRVMTPKERFRVLCHQ
jgi:hypothetical protein